MYYDALVTGAGPGGCMAARSLRGAGFKVEGFGRNRHHWT